MVSDIEHIFICLLAISMPSLKRCLFRSFVYFFIGSGLVFSFFGVKFCKYFINFGYEPLMKMFEMGKNVLPVCGLSFYFVDDFLCFAKTF